jgi:hypothetical protein
MKTLVRRFISDFSFGLMLFVYLTLLCGVVKADPQSLIAGDAPVPLKDAYSHLTRDDGTIKYHKTATENNVPELLSTGDTTI